MKDKLKRTPKVLPFIRCQWNKHGPALLVAKSSLVTLVPVRCGQGSIMALGCGVHFTQIRPHTLNGESSKSRKNHKLCPPRYSLTENLKKIWVSRILLRELREFECLMCYYFLDFFCPVDSRSSWCRYICEDRMLVYSRESLCITAPLLTSI